MRSCAIHQPNFLPRLSTLAKLYAADVWIVLDDVQFARRDYQHRARLAALDDASRRQWLSLPVHLPHGRATHIRDMRLADPDRSARRVAGMLAQHYKQSPHWADLRPRLTPLLDLFTTTDRAAEITEASTHLLLDLLGWQGQIIRSSQLPTHTGRSQRLAELTQATGAGAYLCGTGGMTYLDSTPFTAYGIKVIPFTTPDSDLWQAANQISALRALMVHGPAQMADTMQDLRRANIC
ncbi:WbqC family protein [Streptomyces sp. cg36]|uniref:WbqC family protein n=1 Tax=Streptomyces sp. cg36 TaxID=3238798 RepID=UPI0034E1DFC3